MTDTPTIPESPRARAINPLVPYFAGVALMAFLRETTALPLRVVDVRPDPPDGFYLTLGSGECLRISVASVRTQPPTAF